MHAFGIPPKLSSLTKTYYKSTLTKVRKLDTLFFDVKSSSNVLRDLDGGELEEFVITALD